MMNMTRICFYQHKNNHCYENFPTDDSGRGFWMSRDDETDRESKCYQYFSYFCYQHIGNGTKLTGTKYIDLI